MLAILSKLLLSSVVRELGKRLFLIMAKDYVKKTDTKMDDKILKAIEVSMK